VSIPEMRPELLPHPYREMLLIDRHKSATSVGDRESDIDE